MKNKDSLLVMVGDTISCRVVRVNKTKYYRGSLVYDTCIDERKKIRGLHGKPRIRKQYVIKISNKGEFGIYKWMTSKFALRSGRAVLFEKCTFHKSHLYFKKLHGFLDNM